MEGFFEVGKPRIRAAQDRDFLVRDAVRMQSTHLVDDEGPLGLAGRERTHDRLRPVVA